ncbi:protein MAIN-LIKE 1-like [Lotus japonicus]|uniref:protein MAIN-LIKE 1-like n=1 Tax=Lotus japonicus TaxID=34305 RepID=UPI00258C8676|nr:protein MAIN-LIKE 1-like [Lotus japonicus]
MEPRPIDRSLLRHQGNHVSEKIWTGNERMIRPRHRRRLSMVHEIDSRIRALIDNAGFGHAFEIGDSNIDHHLITALVERWRPETHTFHFPYGEVTITLQDVALQLGLPIDGEVVTGYSSSNWKEVCSLLLGHSPPENDMLGGKVNLTWLENTFEFLPPDATDEVIAQHARAHILLLLGGLLLPDTSGSRVHLMYLQNLVDLPAAQNYSWGSPV